MEQVLIQILNMSLTASYVIIVVLLLRLFLKPAPKAIACALWLVVLFRLLSPVAFVSAFSLIAVNPQAIAPDIVHAQTPVIASGVAAVDQVVNASLPAPAGPYISVNPLQVVFYIGALVWVMGAVLLLLAGLLSQWRLWRHLRPAEQAGDNIFELAGLESAFVVGVWRPKIYLPQELAEKERAYILRHEQVHIKRGDHLVKLAAFIALCLHWFNPLVWLSVHLLNKDMEMACDERVLRELGEGIKKPYSASLLKLSTGRRALGAPLAFGEGELKGRISNVLRYHKPPVWLITLALIAAIAAAAGLAADPQAQAQDKSSGQLAELAASVREQPQIQVNPYEWNSYVYLSGQQIAAWLDQTQWQALDAPPQTEPAVTYSLEALRGPDVVSEIHLYAAQPELALILDGETKRWYTIGAEDYSRFQTLIDEQSVYVYLAGLFDQLAGQPTLSSQPADYIAANPAVYEELLSYREKTLSYCLAQFAQGGQTDLRGHLMAAVCRALLEGDDIDGEFATGQQWYDAWQAQTAAKE